VRGAERRAGLETADRKRPGIEEALGVLERADAQALVAGKTGRLARALPELVALLASAQKQGWALVACDCTLETETPSGEVLANVLGTFAPCERRLISKRTRAALARARAQGVRLGRPPSMPRTRSRGSTKSEPPARAWPRSRTDSTPIASPPHRAAAAGIRPPSATRSAEHGDALAPSQIAGSATPGWHRATS
jgi:Resolvase, N terminal domain